MRAGVCDVFMCTRLQGGAIERVFSLYMRSECITFDYRIGKKRPYRLVCDGKRRSRTFYAGYAYHRPRTKLPKRG